MLEKEPDSMAVTMKQDYAASEVYSTTSEAPPAYKMRQANSVKIAKIIAITVVLSSFILGSFILASSYLQAKQSCDQMQALDAVLNKELMLEAMQQEMPKAQALMQDNLSADEANLQTIDRDDAKKRKQEEARKQHKEDSNESADSEDEDDSSNDGDSDESLDMNNHHHVNLPLDLHLTDLASAILRENQKSRMNCIVERRRSEELVDAPPKMVRLPFGMDLTTDPKQQKVTGERIAIFCESGNELKNEDAEPVRQILIPIPPVRTFGPITHLPQQMGPVPQTIIRQMPRPIFPMPLMNQQQPQQQPQQLPPIPAQMMQAPHPDAPMGRPNFHPFLQQLPQIMAAQMHQQSAPQPQQPGMPPRTEVRIHLQRIPIPEIMRPFLPPQIMRQQPEQEQQPQPQPPQQQPQQQEVQIREMPIDMAIHKFGAPSSDEMNVADFAAQKFTEQLRSLIARIAESEESEEETDSYRNVPDQEGPSPHSDERELQEQQPPRPTEQEMVHQEEQEQPQQQQQQQQQESQVSQQQQQQHLPEPQPMLPMGRIHYGRSLLTPISLPGKVVETSVSEEDAVRPHYVQPRSV